MTEGVDRAGRHSGSWSYIQRSICNHEHDRKTNNLWYPVLGVCCTWCMLYLVYAVLGVCCTWWMLYLVYACTRCMHVLGVNSWSWHGEIQRDDLTLCSAMMVEVEDVKERDGVWRCERCGGYEQIWEIRGTTCLFGLGSIGVITWPIGTHTCRIGDGKLTLTPKSLKSQFHMMISPISSYFSPSRPQLYHHLRPRS